MKKRKVSSFGTKEMRVEKDAEMGGSVRRKGVGRIMLAMPVAHDKSRRMGGKRSGHAFDLETRDPVLTVSHMRLPIYQ